MIGYAISISTLVIVALAVYFLLRLFAEKLTGKTLLQQIGVVVTLTIGSIVGGLAMYYLSPLALQTVNKLAALTTFKPIVMSMCFAAIVILAIWVVKMVISHLISPVFNSKSMLQKVLTGFALYFSIYVTISFSGITGTDSAAWLWAWRFILVIGAIGFGLAALKWWYPQGQDGWGVTGTYILDILLTNYVASAFGWSVFANIQGTIYSTAFFIVLNIAVFWVSFVLGDPKKKMTHRWGYWIVVPYTIVLLTACGWIVYLQASGQLSFHEQEMARLATSANQKTEEVDRVIASIGANDTDKAFNSAVDTLNTIISNQKDPKKKLAEDVFRQEVALQREKIESLRKQLNGYHAAQQNVKRADIVRAKAIEDTVYYLKKKIDDSFSDSLIGSQVVFEGTFDDSNIKADGNIDVVLKGHIQQGDKLVVKAIIEGKSNFDAEEVYVWKGKNFNPQWDTTTNGEFTKTIEVNATNCIQTIWIEKGKNIKAHVMVIRS